MKKAFTLIELLIVIAIIAVLAGMLLPALNSARKTARGIVCFNNLKQLGTMMEFYCNDYSDFFPRWNDGGDYGWDYMWMHYLIRGGNLLDSKANYSQWKLLYCPEAQNDLVQYEKYQAYNQNGQTIVSYGFNMFIASRKRTIIIKNHSTTGMLLENVKLIGSAYYGNMGYNHDEYPDRLLASYHKKQASVLYVDSHVASFQSIPVNYYNQDDLLNKWK